MKTAINLAWVVIGLLNTALGYLIWTYAAWPEGGAVIAMIGILLVVDAAQKLRPKVKFNYLKGVSHV